MKLTAFAAFVLSLCAAFSSAGCTNSSDVFTGGAAALTQADCPYVGMTLPEAFAAEKGGEYEGFAKELDESRYVLAEYQVFGEASEVYGTADKELIRELYEALCETKIESPYNEDEVFADAGDAFFFYDEAGEYIAFHFDYGMASIGKKLYNCTDRKKLNAVRNKFRELYDE